MFQKKKLRFIESANTLTLFEDARRRSSSLWDPLDGTRTAGAFQAQSQMGQACSKVSPGSIPGLMDSAEDSRGELILASSQITEEGAKIIASRLTASTLSRLDLGDNLIGDAGAVAICESLSDNLSLKRLVLMGNQLSDGAVELMVNALMPNRHLRDLDLHDNEITAKGAEHLRRLLQRTHHLESLLVGSNSLGDEGVKHLCKGMRKNHRGKLTNPTRLPWWVC